MKSKTEQLDLVPEAARKRERLAIQRERINGLTARVQELERQLRAAKLEIECLKLERRNLRTSLEAAALPPSVTVELVAALLEFRSAVVDPTGRKNYIGGSMRVGVVAETDMRAVHALAAVPAEILNSAKMEAAK